MICAVVLASAILLRLFSSEEKFKKASDKNLHQSFVIKKEDSAEVVLVSKNLFTPKSEIEFPQHGSEKTDDCVEPRTCKDTQLIFKNVRRAMEAHDGDRMKEWANGLRDIEPNSYVSVKASVLADLLMIIKRTDGSWPNEDEMPELYFTLERDLQEAKNFDVLDPDLIHIESLVRGFKDWDVLESYGHELLFRHPNKGLGYYAIATARYKIDDLEGTKEALEYALELEPDNELFQRAYKKLKLTNKIGTEMEPFDIKVELNEHSEHLPDTFTR